MKLTHEDLIRIRTAFAAARSAGVEAVMISEKKIRGISPTGKAAIIADIGIDTGIAKIGIGKIAELEKRLAIFSTEMTAECTVNANNDCSLLAIKAGRSSIQFKCTSEKFIKYPKSITDPATATLILTKAEVQQIIKAIRTLGAEILTIQIKKSDLSVHVECTSMTHETYKTDIESEAAFEDEAQNIVQTYDGNCISQVLDAASRDSDVIGLILGEGGSLTTMIGNHTMIIMPEANNEGEDE